MNVTEPTRKGEASTVRDLQDLEVELLDPQWVRVSWAGRLDLRRWHRLGNESHLVLDLIDPERGLLYEAVLPRPVDSWRLAVPRPGRYRVELARRTDRRRRETLAVSPDFDVRKTGEDVQGDHSRSPAWMEEEAELRPPV
ncbi:MAG: hypothetical protein QJR14_06740 [Bacillota bacterium]|nr:hypothetical protein [Bacillota bacterium]